MGEKNSNTRRNINLMSHLRK